MNDKLERVSVANELAVYLGVESGLVLEEFRKMAADRTERAPAAARPDPARATDRILLPLLLANHEARPSLIEGLRGITAVRQAPTGPIYDMLTTLHDAGEPIGFNSLHERLAPADQERLAAIVLETDAARLTLEDGLACVEAMRRDEHEATRRDLKARIKLAEREGRIGKLSNYAPAHHNRYGIVNRTVSRCVRSGQTIDTL